MSLDICFTYPLINLSVLIPYILLFYHVRKSYPGSYGNLHRRRSYTYSQAKKGRKLSDHEQSISRLCLGREGYEAFLSVSRLHPPHLNPTWKNWSKTVILSIHKNPYQLKVYWYWALILRSSRINAQLVGLSRFETTTLLNIRRKDLYYNSLYLPT